MELFLNILFLIIGMVLLIKGADFFVTGASAVAKKLKVPSIFIGLTIVAIGTSLPELAISVTSAISKNIDLSVGNVVGSNLCNMLLILGLVAIFSPVAIKKSTKQIDIPFFFGLPCLLLLFCLDKLFFGTNGQISRVEAILIFAVLIVYMFILIKGANKERKMPDYVNVEDHSENQKEYKIWQIVLYIVLGLGAVVFGGECVNQTSQFLAIKAGMSEKLVGLTIVAIGTSLPELATSVIASKKGENELALGNLIGSNILNISLILSTVGIITPIPIPNDTIIDLVILVGATCVVTMFCLLKEKLTRKNGIILILMYATYISFAIIRNYCF